VRVATRGAAQDTGEARRTHATHNTHARGAGADNGREGDDNGGLDDVKNEEAEDEEKDNEEGSTTHSDKGDGDVGRD